MEAQPARANLEPPEPNLLEVFADREVTLFGLTGTFSELAKLCPVDLSDPRINVGMINEFVVKAANEAGMAIEPEYEPVFNRIIEEKGLERKFTLAKAGENAPADVAKKETLQTREAVLAATSPARAKTAAVKEAVVRQQAELVARISEEEAEVVAGPTRAEKVITKAVEAQPVKSASFAQELRKVTAAEKPLRLMAEPPAEIVAVASVDTSERSTEAAVDVEPMASLEMLLAELVPEWIEETPVPDAAITEFADIEPTYAAEAAPIVVLDWETELAKEPLEVYEDFVVALREFAELKLSESSKDEATMSADEVFADDVAEAQVAIVSEVAERLATLDIEEREAVAPVLKDIVGALHGLELLEAREAPPEVIAAAEMKLEALTVALFESLGITYDEETIKLFLNSLHDPEFKPVPVLEQEIDLEHTGTREVKRQLAQFVSNLVRVEDRLQRTIGGVALSAVRFTELPAAA